MKIEVRAGNAVHIEGYVNAVERDSHIITVPSIGQCVEQIRAGVFDKALSSGADVSILENHDNSRRLGSISEGNLKLYEDNIGLRAIADIVDADIADKARRKMLKGWSFGFICTDSEIEQRAGNVPRRIVKGMMLSEVSLIDGAYKPCYNGTLVEVRSEGDIIEYRGGIDETVEVNTPTDNSDTPTENSNSTTENSNSTTVDETVETRSEEPDYSYYDAMLRYLELRYNPYHDPGNGRFCSGGGGGGGMLVVPKGQKGKGFYVGASDRDIAEQALANEFDKWQKNKKSLSSADILEDDAQFNDAKFYGWAQGAKTVEYTDMTGNIRKGETGRPNGGTYRTKYSKEVADYAKMTTQELESELSKHQNISTENYMKFAHSAASKSSSQVKTFSSSDVEIKRIKQVLRRRRSKEKRSVDPV